MAAVLLEAAINDQKNNPETMRKKQKRRKSADLTKQVEMKSKTLTSGTAFFNDMVARNSNDSWHHQLKRYTKKQLKEQMKESTAKQAFITKKQQADDIRKRCQETWNVNDITTLL
jgi:hypothetical protein